MEITSAYVTKSGGRKVNEDSWAIIPVGDAQCLVVADGLGGHRGGKYASQLAVEAVSKSFKKDQCITPEAVRKHIESAQQDILNVQMNNAELKSMRSTIVLLLTNGSQAIWGHIGDTRLYYFSDSRISFQTKDHSVPQMLADIGEIQREDIRHHEDRNRLLKSLGNEDKCVITVADKPITLKSQDAFLLCTDGFWEYVTELDMQSSFSTSDTPELWLEDMEKILKGNKERPEDHDNYTAIALFAS